MISKLRLQHFRQHLDLSVDFAGGINAIRGENEAGKTTVLEAFAYLCFGSRALREPLDSVVTYHQPVSKLRVDGTLTHLGVEYTAYRAKSGAEVTFGRERITGQTECTRFFEKLFGADAEMAGKLMIADQKSLANSLTAGATEAGRLIEDLANFNLIDDIVELAQSKLVAGVTTGVEARIAGLRAQVAEVAVVEDLAPLRLAAFAAEVAVATCGLAYSDVEIKLSSLDVELAKSILADEKRLSALSATLTQELAQIDVALAVEAPVAPAPADIAAARAAVEAEKSYTKAAKAHITLTRAAISGEWDQDLASLVKETADTQVKSTLAELGYAEANKFIGMLDVREATLRKNFAVAVATLEGRLIKETTCAFCDKDLTDVPEVTQRNSRLEVERLNTQNAYNAELAALTEDRRAHHTLRTRHEKERDEADEYLADLRAVLTLNDKVELIYAGAEDFITVDRSTVPGEWVWIGPAVGEIRPDVAAALRKLEQEQTAATTFEATHAAQQKQRDALKAKQEIADAERSALLIGDASETLHDADELTTKLADARDTLQTKKSELASAQSKLSIEVALQLQATKAAEQVKQQLAGAEAELVEMASNNALIKKVRAARPVITDKLWSIVLAGTSGYFSQVRGEPSSITRTDKTFRCNGQPTTGLSGSAQDMLGLAIRIALTKTFLPGCDFLLLDEPAAACSDARESAMLGMLSTLGFGQIVLVTHSDLCDAFSDHLITI